MYFTFIVIIVTIIDNLYVPGPKRLQSKYHAPGPARRYEIYVIQSSTFAFFIA